MTFRCEMFIMKSCGGITCELPEVVHPLLLIVYAPVAEVVDNVAVEKMESAPILHPALSVVKSRYDWILPFVATIAPVVAVIPFLLVVMLFSLAIVPVVPIVVPVPVLDVFGEDSQAYRSDDANVLISTVLVSDTNAEVGTVYVDPVYLTVLEILRSET